MPHIFFGSSIEESSDDESNHSGDVRDITTEAPTSLPQNPSKQVAFISSPSSSGSSSSDDESESWQRCYRFKLGTVALKEIRDERRKRATLIHSHLIKESLINVDLTDAAIHTLAQAAEEYLGDLMIATNAVAKKRKRITILRNDMVEANRWSQLAVDWPTVMIWCGIDVDTILFIRKIVDALQNSVEAHWWVSSQLRRAGLKFIFYEGVHTTTVDAIHTRLLALRFITRRVYPKVDLDCSYNPVILKCEFDILPEYELQARTLPITTSRRPWTPPYALDDVHYATRNFKDALEEISREKERKKEAKIAKRQREEDDNAWDENRKRVKITDASSSSDSDDSSSHSDNSNDSFSLGSVDWNKTSYSSDESEDSKHISDAASDDDIGETLCFINCVVYYCTTLKLVSS